MTDPRIEMLNPADLVAYARNSRTHSAYQVKQIASSIKEFGFTNPVLIADDETVIAGHGRVLAALDLGLSSVPCIRLSHLNETQRRAYVIADNQLALQAGWDDEMLKSELEALRLEDFETDLLGFDEDEIKRINGKEAAPSVTDYSRKIEAPTYTPAEQKPATSELIYLEKVRELEQEIVDSKEITEEETDFLLEAARRHARFDFRSIADYYSHASAPMQRLMEKSGLVIIDFDKAIENGFVALSNRLMEQYAADEGDEE